MMKSNTTPSGITELADRAARETSRWYGRVAYWAAPGTPFMSCRDWFLEHWRQHPSTAPDGVGPIIEHDPLGHLSEAERAALRRRLADLRQ
jgi:hypothetical protein